MFSTLTLSPSPEASPAASAYCRCARGGRNQPARELGQCTASLGLAAVALAQLSGRVPTPLPHPCCPSSASSSHTTGEGVSVVSAALELSCRVNCRTLRSFSWVDAGGWWKDAARLPAALWFVFCESSGWLQMLVLGADAECLKTLISVLGGVEGCHL